MRLTIIAALSILAAALSWRDASLEYWRNQAAMAYEQGHAPSGMPAWVARDPQILVTAAQAAPGGVASRAGDLPEIEANARAALRDAPLNPSALFQLGMVAERRGPPGSGLPFFNLTERLSRREVANELVLERLAAARGDLSGALQRIDHIVSVAPTLAETVFPPMVPALADPGIRAAFEAYAGRPWYASLLSAGIDHGGDADALADMIAAGQSKLPPEVVNDVNARLIGRVVSGGDYAAARRLFGRLPPQWRASLGVLGFTHATADAKFAPLSWAISSDATASGRLAEGGALEVTVAAEQAGQVATRTTLLGAGNYDLYQTLAYSGDDPRAGLTWDVNCAGTEPLSLWHQTLPSRGAARVTYQARIVVPAGCGAQVWRLQALGSPGFTSSTVSLQGLKLVSR